ncbi:MAG: host-nuclease inhibitor Gam family protein [Candidatus Electryoneaceae bacterium]|nr:host-nuclease inhibitor Gam family protein [Candidatus Electryoneaceae bacterium]
MPRKKSTVKLLTAEQVNDAMAEYAYLQAESEKLEAETRQKIILLDEALEEQVLPIDLKMKRLNDQIIYYVTFYRDQFADDRTKTMRHGRIGIRKVRSDKLNVKSHVKGVASLKELKLFSCIRMTEKVDVRELIKQPEDIIEQVEGVNFPTEKETAWFEVNREAESEIG